MSLIANNFEFIQWDEKTPYQYFQPREGETKLGQKLCSLEKAKYVIIGVEESIGPRANLGRGGAENAFKSFLPYFLGMQSNSTLKGDQVHILGSVQTKTKNDGNLRGLVQELDQFLIKLFAEKLSPYQIPILIGGGHNNAYPLIAYSSRFRNQKIDVINLDAHADYRLLEGRHSGNSFSYGFKNGYINKYSVYGLHQRYNSQQILEDLNRDNHFYTFHEDYVMEERSYLKDFQTFLVSNQETGNSIGIELDLDTIENMPSSANSPVGIHVNIARNYIRTMAELPKICYLHLPEGAPQNEKEERIVGKTLAYLVTDFIAVRN